MLTVFYVLLRRKIFILFYYYDKEIFNICLFLVIYIHSYFYSTTKHEIIQIKNHNLLSSLEPPNQSWLF